MPNHTNYVTKLKLCIKKLQSEGFRQNPIPALEEMIQDMINCRENINWAIRAFSGYTKNHLRHEFIPISASFYNL